ncbi:MAG: acetolactate decarboxylase [Nitrososphaerales archaeon]
MKKHGNLGLGTFENLDREMVVIDGHFYHVKSDGSIAEVGVSKQLSSTRPLEIKKQ